MKYYFAPLEGITGYIYRNAHHAFYPGIDRYYTPFIVPKEKRHLNTRERNDVLPEHNTGMTVIPQILTNKADEFVRIAHVLHEEYGYDEVNLNLGCPSKTVVSKKRGAGFLSEPEQLDAFLEETVTGLKDIRLSVKTRIGKDSPKEFTHLLEIYHRYPLSELIVHPRVQTDFYKNTPHLTAFAQAYAYGMDDFSLCYNGDVNTPEDNARILAQFPDVSAVMLGRGLLANPALVETIKLREDGGSEMPEEAQRRRRYEFYRRLLCDYKEALDGERNVLFKLKELWLYLHTDFTEPEKYWKKMKKAQRLCDFEAAVEALFAKQQLVSPGRREHI